MLIFYDKFGKQLDNIDFIELQWNRKLNESGNFMLYTAANKWNHDIKYIHNTGRKEIAIVQKIVFEKKTEGNFITASGFFLEKLLDWGCNYIAKSLSATTYTGVKSKLKEYMNESFGSYDKRQLLSVSIAEDSTLPSSIDQSLEIGTPFGSFLYAFLQDNNLSFYCEPTYGTDEANPLLGLKIHIYKGHDRRNLVYFGEGYNNISRIDYTLDETLEYPLVGVVQEVQAASGFSNVSSVNTKDGVKYFIKETTLIEGNRPSNVGAAYPLRVIAGNVADIEMVSANQAAIRRAMQQQAKLDMLNHYKIETISADVIQNKFLYLQDYDLGDIATVVIDDIEQMFVSRIVEVSEVHRNNSEEITLTLGTPQKSKYRKIQIL